MKSNKKKVVNRKKLKNRFMILAATVGLLAGLYGVGVMADFTPGSHEALVNMLANKFDLNKDEVEETFAEYRKNNRAENQAEMKARLEESLNQAIDDGKITEEQKNLILAKREEMQNKINQDVETWSENHEERREQMESYREEMHQWMEDNGIDEGIIGLGFNKKGHDLKREGMGMGKNRQ